MENFRFENMTKIVFGRATQRQAANYVKMYADELLIVYGGGSAARSGLLEEVKALLQNENCKMYELGGIKANPDISKVRTGIDLCRQNNLNFILAIGGGSVIDTAKAIALGLEYEGDVWDFFIGKAKLQTCSTKIGTILTLPASGSEASASTVLSNQIDGKPYKRDYTHNLLRPVFSILNPELTMSLTKEQTMCGGVDILSHIMERYFTNVKNVELTDRMCEAAMITVINNLRKLTVDLQDYDARSEIMWAGTIAQSNLLSTGRISDWGSHMIEHELSALYDIPHGSGLAVITPAWMKYVYKNNIERFVQFTERVWCIDTTGKSKEVTALEGIKATESFFKEIGQPVRLQELGINRPDTEEIAEKAVMYGDIGNLVKLKKDDVVQIIKLAL